MPKVFTSKSQKIGELGEEIAKRYLEKRGFKIIERNFCSRNGEIDIIAEKDKTRHFVEVKSVSSAISGVKPVENMTTWKIKKQRAVISEYLRTQRNVSDWQADFLFVYLDIKDKTAKVEFLEYAF